MFVRLFQLFLCWLACVIATPAAADINYDFVVVTCAEDVGYFGIKTTKLGGSNEPRSREESSIYQTGSTIPSCNVGGHKVDFVMTPNDVKALKHSPVCRNYKADLFIDEQPILSIPSTHGGCFHEYGQLESFIEFEGMQVRHCVAKRTEANDEESYEYKCEIIRI